MTVRKTKWDEFDVSQVKNHFYLLENTGSANIGVIAVDGAAIVIDSGWFPRISAKVIEHVRTTLGCTVDMLINTHYHSDHTFGNQSFDCPIVAVRECREMMKKAMDKFWTPEEIDKVVQDDPSVGVEWQNLKFTPPTETFEDKKEIDFHGLRLILERVGGHTPDSTWIHAPDHNLIYAGDLVFSQRYPTILDHDSNPIDLMAALGRLMMTMNVSTIIPGHGPICDLKMVQTLIDYWGGLVEAAQALLKLTASEDDAVRSLVAQCRLDQYPYDDFRHRRNCRAVWLAVRRKAVS